jgi:uncharacterized SAM-binding protein YcdF (DUF218 family)
MRALICFRGVWRWACLVAGALLAADGACLMGMGLFSFGVTLPFLIGCSLLALGLAWRRATHWRMASERRRRAWRVGWTVATLWLCSVLAFWTVLARLQDVASETASEPSAILVLGSGTPHGKPSPTLAARLDKALVQAARFPGALVLVSGGVDFGEMQSEGRVMGDYLRAHGVPAARIVQEEKSTSTEQNLLFCRPLLAQSGVPPDAPMLLVTSDFHTLRARWIARRAGYLNVTAVGAPTPLYVRYNAWLREYFAVLSGYLLREF